MEEPKVCPAAEIQSTRRRIYSPTKELFMVDAMQNPTKPI
jgi:hypothetical protein